VLQGKIRFPRDRSNFKFQPMLHLGIIKFLGDEVYNKALTEDVASNKVEIDRVLK
jgi:hypothetical protein